MESPQFSNANGRPSKFMIPIVDEVRSCSLDMFSFSSLHFLLSLSISTPTWQHLCLSLSLSLARAPFYAENGHLTLSCV